MHELFSGQLPLARDEIDSLSRAVARHQDADLLAGNATLPGMVTTQARRALQMPRPFLRFQQIHFIGFSDTVQAAWAIGFSQRQETVAPAKAGVTVYAQLLRSLAHRIRVQQAIGIVQPE